MHIFVLYTMCDVHFASMYIPELSVSDEKKICIKLMKKDINTYADEG